MVVGPVVKQNIYGVAAGGRAMSGPTGSGGGRWRRDGDSAGGCGVRATRRGREIYVNGLFAISLRSFNVHFSDVLVFKKNTIFELIKKSQPRPEFVDKFNR